MSMQRLEIPDIRRCTSEPANILMHNDEPTLLDALDRKALIEEVGDAVANCTPPQVFGVHGDWGLGKTSFLHQVQLYLTGNCPQQSEAAVKNAVTNQYEKRKHKETIRAVWFDAWRYQHEDAPVVALLQEMRVQLSWGHQVNRSVGRGTEIAVRGALLSMEELTKKIGFQYSKFSNANASGRPRTWRFHFPRIHCANTCTKPSVNFCPNLKGRSSTSPRRVH